MIRRNSQYADSTLRLFLPCLELLCTNMLSEHANIPATGSGEEETCTCQKKLAKKIKIRKNVKCYIYAINAL